MRKTSKDSGAQEAERRYQEIEAGEAELISSEEVLRAARERLK